MQKNIKGKYNIRKVISLVVSVAMAFSMVLFSAQLNPAKADSLETVTVDMGSNNGTPTYVGSGFLHSVSTTLPTDGLISQLKPQTWRVGEKGSGMDGFDVYSRLKSMGVQHIEFLISDYTDYDPAYMAMSYENAVTTLVNKAISLGQTYDWDLVNEPELNRSSETAFFDCWNREYRTLKSILPEARTVGPDTYYFDEGYIEDFLTQCAQNDTWPTVVTWHFSTSDSYLSDVEMIKNFISNSSVIQTYLKSKGYTAMPEFTLQEYTGASEAQSLDAGSPACFLAAAERTQANMIHASWYGICGVSTDFTPVLDALTTNDGLLPRGVWWTYKTYADMAGTMLNVTRSTDFDGVASTDASTQSSLTLLGCKDGGTGGTARVNFSNINKTPYLMNDGTVNVEVDAIPNTSSAVENLTAVINSSYTVSNNVLSVMVPIPSGTAVRITLTPGDGNTSTGGGTAGGNSTVTSYTASDGFSSTTQGANQWSYMYSDGGGFVPMFWDNANNWWEGSEEYALIANNQQCPGTGCDVARAWTAPEDGTVHITGTATSWMDGGNGINLKIIQDTSQLWPANDWSYIPALASVSQDLTTNVKAGNVIYFVTNSNGNNYDDTTIWDPTITYVTGDTGSSGTNPGGGTEQTPSNSVKMEAEDAVFGGQAAVYEDANASGGLAAGWIFSPGDSVTFTNVPASDQMTIRYSTPNPTGQLALYINGVFNQEIVFPTTNDWNTYGDKTVNVNIPNNASVMLIVDSNENGANLDYAVFLPAETGTTPTGSVKMEAEDAVFGGQAAAYADANASGGLAAGWIFQPDDSVTFTNVPASNQMTIRYSTPNPTGQVDLYINGVFNQQIVFPSTNDWNTYGDKTVNVSIPNNASVMLIVGGGENGANFDYVTFTNS